jgi:hypothetical protein
MIPRVSYDLAVWEGERPPTDEAAGELFQSLSERYLEAEADEPEPPSDRIRAYVSALVERYPDDLPDNDVDDCPWAVGPLVSAAVGPLIDFPMVWSRCEEVSAWPRISPPHMAWSATTPNWTVCVRLNSQRNVNIRLNSPRQRAAA